MDNNGEDEAQRPGSSAPETSARRSSSCWVAEGGKVAGAARSDATLEGVTPLGVLALRSDVTDAASVTRALEQAAEAHGGVDLVVNAAAAYGGRRHGPFGGGPVAEARTRRLRRLGCGPRPLGLYLPVRHRAVPAQARGPGDGRPGHRRLRQARHGRPRPVGGGLFAVRAITNAAALELREEGIQVTLLIVDAGIEPPSGPYPGTKT